jgi:hypothetical protein
VATVRPASLAGLVASMIDSASSFVRSLGPSDKVTEMYPICLFLLSASAPFLESGLTALTTPGSFFSDLTVAPTAFEFAELVSLPLGAWSTIGFVPYACFGSFDCSRSCALVEPVPGSDRLSLFCSPAALAPSASATTASTQTAITGQ